MVVLFEYEQPLFILSWKPVEAWSNLGIPFPSLHLRFTLSYPT